MNKILDWRHRTRESNIQFTIVKLESNPLIVECAVTTDNDIHIFPLGIEDLWDAVKGYLQNIPADIAEEYAGLARRRREALLIGGRTYGRFE